MQHLQIKSPRDNWHIKHVNNVTIEQAFYTIKMHSSPQNVTNSQMSIIEEWIEHLNTLRVSN